MEDKKIIELIKEKINHIEGLTKHEDIQVNKVRLATIFELAGILKTIKETTRKERRIQDEITITQEEIDKTIEHYKRMSDTFRIGILSTILDKNGIIEEIKKLSKIGKTILLMEHRFTKWEKEEEKARKKK